MLSDEWLPRYRLLENFTAKWNGNGNGNENGNGNGNAYDRGDYNSSFALRAVELKMVRMNFIFILPIKIAISNQVLSRLEDKMKIKIKFIQMIFQLNSIGKMVRMNFIFILPIKIAISHQVLSLGVI